MTGLDWDLELTLLSWSSVKGELHEGTRTDRGPVSVETRGVRVEEDGRVLGVG